LYKPFPFLFKQLWEFAEVCADAYINQYLDPQGLKVSGHPVVLFNLKDNSFEWTSSDRYLSEFEISLAQIEKDHYDVLGDDLFMARYLIIEEIMVDPCSYTLIDSINNQNAATHQSLFGGTGPD
jgi:hypothetical protein